MIYCTNCKKSVEADAILEGDTLRMKCPTCSILVGTVKLSEMPDQAEKPQPVSSMKIAKEMEASFGTVVGAESGRIVTDEPDIEEVEKEVPPIEPDPKLMPEPKRRGRKPKNETSA